VKVLRRSAVAVACAFIFSACGSSGSSSSTQTSRATASSGSSSGARVSAPPLTPPANIQVSTPLTKKPPTGKKVIALICQVPECALYQAGVRAAATALGWHVEFMTLNNAAPAASLSEAVAQKPDYIFLSGIPEAVLKAPLAQAHAAHIPVISAADPDLASPTGFAVQVGGTLIPDSENIAHWIINDSGGTANIVVVTIPQFPVLVDAAKWVESNVPHLCSGCHVDELDFTLPDLGAGKVPGILTAYLQAHPNTKYVFFTFADLATTVAPVLKSSGFAKVKLTGAAGDATIAKQIAGGEQTAWTIAPSTYLGYESVDAMARLSDGMNISGAYAASVFPLPSWVVASPAAANQYLKPTAYQWPGPAGYQQQFEKLEHVG
jgi:ABC-type sugar transport system substrate-binding protein